jgi:hypothetical protein
MNSIIRDLTPKTSKPFLTITKVGFLICSARVCLSFFNTIKTLLSLIPNQIHYFYLQIMVFS